jgi:uncharacterized membrane protein
MVRPSLDGPDGDVCVCSFRVGHPVSLVVLRLFIVYQLYCFFHTRGFGLIVSTVFDVVAMGSIWHEYRLIRRHLTSR